MLEHTLQFGWKTCRDGWAGIAKGSKFQSMKYTSLIIIFLVAFFGHLWAFDTYDPKTSQLSIPIVSVDSIIYSDVIVTIDKVIDIGSSASTTQYDLYDQVTNQLVIPSVKVGSSTYNNVVVTISSVLNIGGILSSSDPSDATFDSFLYSDNFKPVLGIKVPSYIVNTNGSFTPTIPSENWTFIGIVTTGDFNHDGLDDAILTWSDTNVIPHLYLSNGDGTFKSSNDWIPPEAARRHIRNAFAVDLNKDGLLDYVGFTAPHGFHEDTLGPDWGFTEPDLILINTGNGFDMVPNLESDSHHGGAVGDINNDGLVDVFGLSEYPSPNGDLRAPLVQTSPFNFVKSQISLLGLFEDCMTSDMRMADLNNDGLLDFVISIAPKQQIIGGPVGTPMANSNLGTFSYAYGDGTLNIDKLKWVRMGTHWMDESDWNDFLKFNDQTTPTDYTYSAGPSNIELLDVNGDGLLDILEGFYVAAPFSWRTSGFKYYQNTGTGFLDLTSQVFPNQTTNRNYNPPSDFIYGFRMLDINGDALKDLVIIQYQSERSTDNLPKESNLFFINQNNVFYPVNRTKHDFSLNGWYGLGVYGTGDFNGDGAIDIIDVQDINLPNMPQGHYFITHINKNVPKD